MAATVAKRCTLPTCTCNVYAPPRQSSFLKNYNCEKCQHSVLAHDHLTEEEVNEIRARGQEDGVPCQCEDCNCEAYKSTRSKTCRKCKHAETEHRYPTKLDLEVREAVQAASAIGCLTEECECNGFAPRKQNTTTYCEDQHECANCRHRLTVHRPMTETERAVHDVIVEAYKAPCCNVTPPEEGSQPGHKKHKPLIAELLDSDIEQEQGKSCRCSGFSANSLQRAWQSTKGLGPEEASSAVLGLKCTSCTHPLEAHRQRTPHEEQSLRQRTQRQSRLLSATAIPSGAEAHLSTHTNTENSTPGPSPSLIILTSDRVNMYPLHCDTHKNEESSDSEEEGEDKPPPSKNPLGPGSDFSAAAVGADKLKNEDAILSADWDDTRMSNPRKYGDTQPLSHGGPINRYVAVAEPRGHWLRIVDTNTQRALPAVWEPDVPLTCVTWHPKEEGVFATAHTDGTVRLWTCAPKYPDGTHPSKKTEIGKGKTEKEEKPTKKKELKPKRQSGKGKKGKQKTEAEDTEEAPVSESKSDASPQKEKPENTDIPDTKAPENESEKGKDDVMEVDPPASQGDACKPENEQKPEVELEKPKVVLPTPVTLPNGMVVVALTEEMGEGWGGARLQLSPLASVSALHEDPTTLSFSPDGRYLAVGGSAGEVGFCSISIGRQSSQSDGNVDKETILLVHTCRISYGGVSAVAWDPSTRYVAVGGEDDLVTIFNVRPPQQTVASDVKPPQNEKPIDKGQENVSPTTNEPPEDGDNKPRKRKIESASGPASKKQKSAPVAMMSITKMFARATEARREMFKFWCVLRAHNSFVTSLAFTKCGSHLISGGLDGYVYMWPTADWSDISIARHHQRSVEHQTDVAVNDPKVLIGHANCSFRVAKGGPVLGLECGRDWLAVLLPAAVAVYAMPPCLEGV